MSSTRGRTIRRGGMAIDAGANGRTEPGPANAPITRPAYRTVQGVSQPAGVGGADGPHPFLDLRGVPAWRLIAVGLAAAWLGFVWISLRGGISGGVRV